MKKLILTSSQFTGEIHVLYFDSKLVQFDLQQAEITDIQIDFLKKRVPVEFVNIESFINSFESKTLIVIEEGYKVSFEEFWNKYNQKRNKERAIKLWDKLSVADQVKAFIGLTPYKSFLRLNPWRTIKEPDTYLKERSWENEWK